MGRSFDHRVWALLRVVPYGTTRSHADLARELERERALLHLEDPARSGEQLLF